MQEANGACSTAHPYFWGISPSGQHSCSPWASSLSLNVHRQQASLQLLGGSWGQLCSQHQALAFLVCEGFQGTQTSHDLKIPYNSVMVLLSPGFLVPPRPAAGASTGVEERAYFQQLVYLREELTDSPIGFPKARVAGDQGWGGISSCSAANCICH